MEWIQIFSSTQEAHEKVSENKPRLLIVRGHRICLVNQDGAFHAFQDACTHNSESLSKGELNYRGEIICPLHGYRFNVKTGRECDQRSRDLELYPVREDETGFYIGI